ncbi:MAG: stage 0 sporulation protein [Chitinispirillaceae bacterium]|nr:stage 0 sporulation protein [Chitinispirillaceae bacterium]
MGKNARLVEVIFKGERRVIYRDRNELEIAEGDFVIVEAERGNDMGKASLVGSLVRLKRGKGETRSIIRKANDHDIEVYTKNREKEKSAHKVCKEKIREFNLDMKLIDVEMQHDGSKITFYFTAAQRVDFRELVKDLASIYRTRIELRQIGVRDEAKRISGCGVCGRKQCCSAFLTEFEQITTQMAKNQQLALNPSKLSGNCGRLLCCLRYEDDTYIEFCKDYPPVGVPITLDGKRGMLTFISLFNNKGLFHFDEGGQEWFTPEELKKGIVENVVV